MLPDRYYSTQLIPRPHVLIFGAGASKAAELHGDSLGITLPVINELPAAIELETLVGSDEVEEARTDFESYFSRISTLPEYSAVAQEIEERIYGYFKSIPISKTVTVYDRFVLSLRAKDCIATFNWDPLLGYAYRRNGFLGTLPELFFLHGNVLSGYCEKDKVFGWTDDNCFQCNSAFQRSRLLYPIRKKDYSRDPYLVYQWDRLQELLAGSWFVTIFGYSAPKTDMDATSRIIHALNNNEVKHLMEIEVINLKHKELLSITGPIGSIVDKKHAYGVADWQSAYSLHYPCFSVEALFQAVMQNNPLPCIEVPDTNSLEELQGWYKEIISLFPVFLQEGYSKKAEKRGS